MTIYNKQQGLSLIELLVALALAASLSTAIYQIVLSNRVNIELVESHSKVQESARLALDMMSRDLRMAGYTGCVNNVDQIKTLLDATGSGYDAVLHDYSNPNIITMWAKDSYQSSDGKIGNVMPVAGSDVFFSRGATSSDLYLSANVTNSANILTLSGPKRELDLATKPGTVLMVTNCERADIFAVSAGVSSTGAVTLATAVADGPNNSVNTIGRSYKKGSQVLIMNSFAYFIGPSSVVKDKAGNSVNALYKYSMLGGANAVELVPYVETLQLAYGVDTDGDKSVDSYKRADELTDLSFSQQVKSVQISMTIAGDTDINANNSDGFLRKEYNRVVQIRNSYLGEIPAGGP